MEKLAQIASTPFAGDVGIVSRGHEAHSLRRARKHVAERVGEPLDLVRFEPNLIVDDIIVSGPSGALQPAVCYTRCQ